MSIIELDLGSTGPRPRGKDAGHGAALTLFDNLVVAPFRIVVDTREQLPYQFANVRGGKGETVVVPTITKTLHSGDYSLEGFEDAFSVERKSLEDLVGSVTHGRDRFEREIQRLNELPGFACVVIEASWHEILHPEESDPTWSNRTRPASVVGTILAWSIRYPRVHWWPVGTRPECERRVFEVCEMFWKEQRKTRVV